VRINVQVCRHGRSHQLEHLLFYGADVNALNKHGNTALHVCALNGHVSLYLLIIEWYGPPGKRFKVTVWRSYQKWIVLSEFVVLWCSAGVRDCI